VSVKGVAWDEWLGSTLLYEYGDVCATDEMDCVGQVIIIGELVASLIRHGGDLVAKVANGQAQTTSKDRDLYTKFVHSLDINLDLVGMVFPRHRYSPYFELYKRHLGDRQRLKAMMSVKDIDGLNRALNAMCREARTPRFKKIMDNHRRGPRKNANGAFRYVRALLSRNPGLRVIELELTYQREHELTVRKLFAKMKKDLQDPVTAETAWCHREVFLNHLRYRYPTMVGYIWMMRHSAYKSFHTRWTIFLDGHEFETDECIGHAMGAYWRYDITRQRGSYWCLNGLRGAQKRDLSAGRKINDCDTDLRVSLEGRLRCLAWADYFIRLDTRGIDRIVGKGGMPKPVSTLSGWGGSSITYAPRGRPIQLELNELMVP